MPKVSVQDAAVLVLSHQHPKIAEVVPELRRRYGGILPAFPCERLSGDMRNGSQAGLANFPDFFCLALVAEQPNVGGVGIFVQGFNHLLGTIVSFGLRIAPELDK